MLLDLVNLSKHIASASCYSDITLFMPIIILKINAKSHTIEYTFLLH